MIPNPIRKVLFTIRKHQLRSLLMGGQACVFYGAAEFSRDTDLAQSNKKARDIARWAKRHAVPLLQRLTARCGNHT